MRKALRSMRIVSALFAAGAVAGALAQGAPQGGAGRRGGDAGAAGAAPAMTIDQRTATLKKMDGFFPIYLDAKTGRLYLEIAKFDSEFLYELHAANGTGAGVSRGAIGRPYVVKFSRIGGKILLTAENFTWRTGSTDPNEQRAVKESFPESVLAGFAVAAEDAPDHVLVDATDFFLRDAEDFADRMGAGYRLDLTRSAILPENTKAFPKNDEVGTLLTFTNSGA